MSVNTFGRVLRFTTWGESHGPALGAIVDGCPPGLELAEADIQPFLDARKPGQSKFTTQRKEADLVKILSGTFDANLDGTRDEQHPEWKGTIDWLGLQYYFRGGVSGDRPILPAPLSLTPCTSGLDFGSCFPSPQPSYCVPMMGYEGWIDRPAYFTDALYEESARLTAAVCDRYGIPKDRAHILGHYEVPGTDHTDPGPNWDWTRYIRLVNFA